VLYLTGAMTGMRRGELIALRWQDIDWNVGLIRVRRTFNRGQFGTPKTRRSSRAVPLADRLRADLDQHFRNSDFQGELDLVFCHPRHGRVLDPSRVRKRVRVSARGYGLMAVVDSLR
jgi:integrase